jgi:L-amino acid N-acyltransferase YncA
MTTTLKNGFTLRWAKGFNEQEVNGIVDVMNAIIEQETIIGYTTKLDRETGAKMIGELGEEAAQESCHVLLGYDQAGTVQGMVILRQNKQPNCRHIAELSKGIIFPGSRARGLLRSALQEVAFKCQALGVELLTLDVRAGTRSEKLWRAVGFQAYGKLEDYARVNQQVHAGYFMSQYVSDLLKHLPPL